MLKNFYHEKQSVKSNSSFSPSAGKPELVVDSWKKMQRPFEIVTFDPVTRNDLYLVHKPRMEERDFCVMKDLARIEYSTRDFTGRWLSKRY